VWYDTVLCDWVIQLPFEGLSGGALLPLGIGWFDANWAAVYRAAADVCYADDPGPRAAGDDRPDLPADL
jgi:hypothetical protein